MKCGDGFTCGYIDAHLQCECVHKRVVCLHKSSFCMSSLKFVCA